MLGGAGRAYAHGEYEVHFETDQLFGEAEELFVTFCLTELNGEVLSFNIATLAQTLAEGGVNAADCQKTDPVDLPLLRVGRRSGNQHGKCQRENNDYFLHGFLPLTFPEIMRQQPLFSKF